MTVLEEDCTTSETSTAISEEDHFDIINLIQEVNKYLVLAELEWFFLSKND